MRSLSDPSFYKTKEVILYILDKVDHPLEEETLKAVLYFADFDYFEKYEENLMGLTYRKNAC